MSANPSQAARTSRSAEDHPEVTFRELVRGFRALGIENKPVLVHSSLKAFGQVQGGSQAVIAALLDQFKTVVMPVFTYKTLVVPESGPPDNAVVYGGHADRNKMAEFFYPDMPADRLMGRIAETLRVHPNAHRSGHPVLSFCGVNAREYLDTQVLAEPFAPIAAMYDKDGWVLLIGVDHRSNTSIHLGERLAGRKTFVRWALMSDMIVRCPNFPYCSDGFNAIQALLGPFIRQTQIGDALVQAMPMHELIETTRQLVQTDPLALLCSRTDCLSCNTVRRLVIQARHSPG